MLSVSFVAVACCEDTGCRHARTHAHAHWFVFEPVWQGVAFERALIASLKPPPSWLVSVGAVGQRAGSLPLLQREPGEPHVVRDQRIHVVPDQRTACAPTPDFLHQHRNRLKDRRGPVRSDASAIAWVRACTVHARTAVSANPVGASKLNEWHM